MCMHVSVVQETSFYTDCNSKSRPLSTYNSLNLKRKKKSTLFFFFVDLYIHINNRLLEILSFSLLNSLLLYSRRRKENLPRKT